MKRNELLQFLRWLGERYQPVTTPTGKCWFDGGINSDNLHPETVVEEYIGLQAPNREVLSPSDAVVGFIFRVHDSENGGWYATSIEQVHANGNLIVKDVDNRSCNQGARWMLLSDEFTDPKICKPI